MEETKKLYIFNEETCVMCGAPIPEGAQVCQSCIAALDQPASPPPEAKPETMSTWDAHLKWGVTKRHAAKLCELGRVPGAYKINETWYIPVDAERPRDGRVKTGKYIKPKQRP